MEFNPFADPAIPVMVVKQNTTVDGSGIVGVACPVRNVRAVLGVTFDGKGASGPANVECLGFSGPTVDVQFFSPTSIGSGLPAEQVPAVSGTGYSGGKLRLSVLGD